MTETRLAAAGFEDGWGPLTKESGQPLGAGRVQKMNSPLGPPERKKDLLTP